MKKINLLSLFISLCAVFFTSCDNNDDPNPKPSYESQISGEWLENLSSDSKVMIGEETFIDGGSYKYTTTIASASEDVNLFDKGTGKYSINGDVLTTVDENNFTVNRTIQNIDNYSIRLLNKDVSNVSTLNRIVNTYTINVGESVIFDYADSNFTPQSYSSLDSQIATVDNGKITANKVGKTFIKVVSSAGTVYARVIVKDPNNIIEDYSLSLGLTLQDITKQYGNNYKRLTSDKIDCYLFFPGQEDISELAFYFVSGKIESIICTVREGYNINDIIASFNKKFTMTSQNGNTEYFYKGKNGSTEFGCFINTEERTIFYKVAQNEFAFLSSLIYQDVDAVAEALDYTLPEEESGAFMCNYDGDYFSKVTVSYDVATRNVNIISLRTKSGIVMDDITPWYLDNYFDTGNSALGLCDQEDFLNMELHPVFVQFKQKTEYINVTYMKM